MSVPKTANTDLTTLEMYVIDPESGDTIQYNIPIDPSGAFTLNLKQGSYALLFKGKGYEDLVTPLSITVNSDKNGIMLEKALMLELIEKEPMVFEGDESAIELREKEYTGTVGVPLLIPVKVDKGSTLHMKVYHDSLLVRTDTIQVDRRRVNLELIPLLGPNLVQLEMTDDDGNIHRNSLIVHGIAAEPVKSRKERKIEEVALALPETSQPDLSETGDTTLAPHLHLTTAAPADPGEIPGESKGVGLPVILGSRFRITPSAVYSYIYKAKTAGRLKSFTANIWRCQLNF